MSEKRKKKKEVLASTSTVGGTWLGKFEAVERGGGGFHGGGGGFHGGGFGGGGGGVHGGGFGGGGIHGGGFHGGGGGRGGGGGGFHHGGGFHGGHGGYGRFFNGRVGWFRYYPSFWYGLYPLALLASGIYGWTLLNGLYYNERQYPGVSLTGTQLQYALATAHAAAMENGVPEDQVQHAIKDYLPGQINEARSSVE